MAISERASSCSTDVVNIPKDDDAGDGKNKNLFNSVVSRRAMMFQSSLLSSSTLAVAVLAVATGTIFPQAVVAKNNDDNNNGDGNTSSSSSSSAGLLSTNDVADLLHSIPTFTIVDKKGVPFMVVGEDAKVTGYFFTTYDEANRILQLAQTSADTAIAKLTKEEKLQLGGDDGVINPWNKARISTVPLDTAITVVSKSATFGSSTLGRGNYFQMAPAEQDVQEALALTGDDDLAEGKVPLFYHPDFTIPTTTTTIDGETISKVPIYFRKFELEQALLRYNQNKKNDPLPMDKIMVSELFSLLAELVKPGGTDEDLKTLMFIPPKESESRKKQCEQKGGKEAPFFIGERIVVL